LFASCFVEEEEEEEDENSNSTNSCGEEDEEAEEEEDAWSLNVDCLRAGFLKCHYCFSLQQSVGGIIFFLLLAHRRFCRGTCVATFLVFCFFCAFSVLRLDTPFSAFGLLEGRKFAAREVCLHPCFLACIVVVLGEIRRELLCRISWHLMWISFERSLFLNNTIEV
jgi:uncharacterized membrane protein